jgi:hypothetical protein
MKVVFSGCNVGGLVGLWDIEDDRIDRLHDSSFTGLCRYGNTVLAINQAAFHQFKDNPDVFYVQDCLSERKYQFESNPPHDPHDIKIVNGSLYAVSAADNSVKVYRFNGDKLKYVRAIPVFPTDGKRGEDALHINSIVPTNGGLLVSCFGLFNKKQGWRDQEGTGLIAKMDYGWSIYVSGLDQPHSLYVEGSTLYYCNSAKSQVVAHDPHNRQVYQFKRYVRGLCRLPNGGWVVGESSWRHQKNDEKKDAHLVLCDREFNMLRRKPIPGCTEVYDILCL